MKVTCEIIEDLLPLYVDDVCSVQSRQAVEQHLEECEKCRRAFDSTQTVPVPQIEPDQPKVDMAVKKGFRKIRIRWWAAILIILALIPIAFLGWNEYSGRGVAYSNQHELFVGNGFMDCLVEHRYTLAYNYLDIADLKKEWLNEWFDEDTLINMEDDALAKFCEMGSIMDDTAGGIESYKYVGISIGGEDDDGTKIYSIIYKIQFNGKETLFQVNVSEDGVESFHGGGSFVDDPLAQFSIWSEYLWQDYEGCYFDPVSGEYVYYDKEQ